MLATTDREFNSPEAVYVDLTEAASSADAIRHLEFYLESTNTRHSILDVNTGHLLLTPGVLSRIKAVARRFANRIQTLYSQVPQTQQTALDEGLLVRRQPLEYQETAVEATPDKSEGTVSISKARGSRQKSADTPTKVEEEQTVSEETVAISRPKATIRYRHSAIGSAKGDDEALFALLEEEAEQALQDNPERVVLEGMETLLVKQTLRSGQVLEAEGHVVLIGDAHSGSEIIAQGDIVVWGVLGGIAHAGSLGLLSAEIRALKIEAVQLRIGHLIARRPDRLFKQSTAGQGPEIARVSDNEIRIFYDTVDKHL